MPSPNDMHKELLQARDMIVKNIALLGHKDHGKSTLIGSMLMQTGAATQVRINEARTYSRKLHKPFEPAFILDSLEEEREQEMTYDTTRAEIEYKNIAFAFIDVPGHEELIKNMISGASYGEIAILLVSAKMDEGIKKQTKRHLFISRMLGISRLIVAVNKMDSVGYDKGRFEEIENGLSGFINKIGFGIKDTCFVPISAYNGENLVKKSGKMRWYKGGTLIDAIYRYAHKDNPSRTGHLRAIIQGVIDANNNIIGGKIISGRLKAGEAICIMPNLENARAKEIIANGKKVSAANAGDNIAIKLDKKINFELRGTVICESRNRPILTDTVKARIFVTNKIAKNMQIKFNGIDIKCRKIKVLDKIDTTTGIKSKANEFEILNAVDAEVKLERKLPIEEFETTMELGRFVLYSNGEFAGIGIVKSTQ